MTDEQNTPKNIPTEDYSILPQQITETLISAAAAARKETDPNGPAPDLTVQQALEILNNAENISESVKRLVRAAQAKVKIQALEDALNVRRKRATRRKKQPESIDIEKWITDTEATAAALEESNKELAHAVKKAMEKIENIAADKNSAIRNAIFDSQEKIDLVMDAQQVLRKSMEEAAPTIKGIGDTVAGIVRQYAGIEKFITALNESMPDWLKIAIADYVELKPYLMAELEKPEYEGATLEELMNAPALDANAKPSKSALLLERAMASARKAQEDGEPLPPRYRLNLQQFAEENIPSVDGKRANKIEYPVDKINAAIWNLLEEDTHGQLRFAMEKAGGKSKKQLDLIYSIDFSALEETGVKVSKRLSPFDKRAYIAISALYNAGNSSMTLSQIHYAMGNTTRPSSNQLERLNDAITKMARAWVTVNDKAEHIAYSYDIDEHMDDNEGAGIGWRMGIYDGSLLPIERGQVIVNGRLADAAINLFREPPMMTFAKLRDQVTTVDSKLLQSPASKTDGNLQLEDYLITRITKAKRKKRQEKILFKTLYEKAGITEKKQRQRAPGKVRIYLDYFQKQGLFSSYIIEADSMTVFF